jgi:hypothetical protein
MSDCFGNGDKKRASDMLSKGRVLGFSVAKIRRPPTRRKDNSHKCCLMSRGKVPFNSHFETLQVD